jgi:hypothetical protein
MADLKAVARDCIMDRQSQTLLLLKIARSRETVAAADNNRMHKVLKAMVRVVEEALLEATDNESGKLH